MTDPLFSLCEEILLSEIGVIPQSSTCSLHGRESWQRLSEESGVPNGCLGVYFPRNLSANVLEESEYLPINILHEYFGHGLFCEHSEIGKKLVLLEKELEGIEHKIRASDSEGSPHIIVRSGKPFFEEYTKKRAETISFMQQTYKFYEGFALWMEHYLAGAIGKSKMFDEKLGQFITPYQKGLFLDQLAFSEQHSNGSLFDMMGFY